MSTLAIAGRACFLHRWITLLAWIAGLAILITLWQLVRHIRQAGH